MTAAPAEAAFHDAFVQLSAALTGFGALELEGTGVAGDYSSFVQQLVDAIASESPLFAQRFDAVLTTGPAEALTASSTDNPLGQLLQNITLLWYIGTWEQLPDTWYSAIGATRPVVDTTHIPSTLAYAEGLAWRVACAHPPGSRPTGYGGWGLAPVVRDGELPPIARGVPVNPPTSTTAGGTR